MSWSRFYPSKETRTSSSPTGEKMSGELEGNVIFSRPGMPPLPTCPTVNVEDDRWAWMSQPWETNETF